MEQMDVLIIGAGLTGLSTAHYLRKKGVSFKVLEREERVGGAIETKKEKGFVYEQGPNTGVLGSPEIAELFEDIKDECELEVADEAAKKRYVLKDGRWVALPAGLKEGITTPLFTWKDKFRLLVEPFRKKGKNPHETLAELVKRRMGNSFLNYAVDPFILGVYSGDPHLLVPKYALPKLYNLEQDYGSFIGGAVKKRFEEKTEREKKATRDVFSVKGGLSGLTKALYNTVGEGHFVLGAKQISVFQEENGYRVAATVNGEEWDYYAKKVITTTSSPELPRMLPFVDKEALQGLSSLRYARVIEVVLGFNNWQGMKLDGFGGLIPHKEKRDMLGVLFLSSFLKNRAPEKGALLTIFMGGVRRDEIVDWPDDKVKEVVASEVKDLMQLHDFNPDLFRIKRYQEAIPQYMEDSGERFKTIEHLQKQHPGLILGGNMRDGIGMADRVKQARMLAEAVNHA